MHRRVSWPLAAAFALGAVLAGAQAPSQTPVARTLQVLDLFYAGKYESIYEMFSPAVRNAFSLEQYRAAAARVAALGPVVRRGDPTVDTVDAMTVVTIPLQLSARALSFRVGWNKAGQIEGAWFGPAPTPPRPQEPKAPFPYKTDPVSFSSKAAGVTMSGTLTIPQGAGPFPAVVLVGGSGPNDRDESGFGHRPFLVLADYLTRQGIAVLRYDKRGYGRPLEEFYKTTLGDFADDAEGAFQYLRARPEVDRDAVGLLGHSEGGIVVPMVTARRPDVRFVVLLGASGVSGAEVLKMQAARLAEAEGATPAAIQQNAAIQEKIFAIVAAEKDDAAAHAKILALMGNGPTGQMEAQRSATAWMRSFLFYDPAPTLEKVKCPVLAVTGDRDLQVPADQNLPAIEAALKKGGNQDCQVSRLPGLNHLFQTARTGSIAEYERSQETVSPTALQAIATWILAHTVARR